MKIAIVPDIHLGSRSFGKDSPDKLNSRIQDQLDLMYYVYDKCLNNKVGRMILLGDIFDKEHPEPALISEFFKWLTKCTDSFNVDIILGNHDFKRVGNKAISILDTIPAARIKNCNVILEICTKKYDDLSITYIPYFDRKELSFQKNSEAVDFIVKSINESLSINKCNKNIALGHMAIEKSIYVGEEIEDEYNEIFLPTSAFKLFDYTWMGHIHDAQILNRKPFVAHLGSLDRYSFKDKDKFICIYDSETNLFKDYKLPCRNLVDVSIVVPSDVTNTNDYVRNEINKIEQETLQGAILRIKIDIESSEADSLSKKDILSLFSSMNIQHVTELTERKKVAIVETKVDIDETTNPYKAVDKFMEVVDINNDFKQQISNACKDIIKELYQ